MIPQRLSLSMARCRAWLAGRALPRSGQSRRSPEGRRFFRPQLALLEDRCVPTTMYSLTAGSMTISRPDMSGAFSSIVRELAESYEQPLSQQQLILIYQPEEYGQVGAPTGIGWMTWGANSNEIMISFMPGFDPSVAGHDLDMFSSGPMVIVVTPPSAGPPPPPRGGPPPQTPPADAPAQTVSWWSQTPHAGPGELLLLPAANQTISAIPAGQSSTPVMLFLPQQTAITGDLKPIHAIATGTPASDLSTGLLASTSPPAAMARTRNGADRNSSRIPRTQQGESDDFVRSEGVALVRPNLDSDLGKQLTQDELIALTRKILRESSEANPEDNGSRLNIIVKAGAACAAVQSVWLGFRYFAAARTRNHTGLRGEGSSWIWRRRQNRSLPAAGDDQGKFPKNS